MVENANFSADQKSRSEDAAWYCLAEFSLSEFVSDQDRRGELTAKLLFQTVRELGIPPECVENIEMTLTGFANEAVVHFKQGSVELPGRIRVFCRDNLIADANSAKEASAPYHAEPGKAHAPAIPSPGTKINGGWGYFIIERFGDDAGSAERARPFVDLYLYKEGE